MGKIGNLTIPGTGAVAFSSSLLNVTGVKIQAHPSNGGPVYVKLASATAEGYPLAAGASVDLGRSVLSDYVASGSPNERLSYIYEQ